MSIVLRFKKPATPAVPAATFEATCLFTEPGRRGAKLYRDPDGAPDDYDAGTFFQVDELQFPTFGEFVAALEALPSDAFIIRGSLKTEWREYVQAGGQVRRLVLDRDDCTAPFEYCARNWIVLDADKADAPFDLNDPEGSVCAWHETLPDEIRNAESAFLLSASAHRSPTVRGKLVVALDGPLDDASAEAYAKANGFDGSVCRTVQPNYFAAPIFEGCTDPLAGRRGAIRFAGMPAHLPAVPKGKKTSKASKAALAPAERVPSDVPEPSARVLELATEAFQTRWLAGGRIEANAWLNLCGWALSRGWTKSELGALLVVLDDREPDAGKRREHWHILGNARAIDGPGGARAWLGDDFARVDAIMNGSLAKALKRAEAAKAPTPPDHSKFGPVASADAPTLPYSVPLDDSEDEPIEWVCEGLRIAPSDGKVTMIGGAPGASKGPLAIYFAVCAALGEKAFGRFPFKKSRVLFLDGEGLKLSRRRMRRFARGLGRDPKELASSMFVRDVSSDNLLTDFERIKSEVVERKIDVLVLDSYTSTMLSTGLDSNKPEWATFAKMLGSLEITVILVVHTNKSPAPGERPTLVHIAGSGALGSLAATGIIVWRPDESKPYDVKVACLRAPETQFEPFDLTFVDGANDSLAVTMISKSEAAREAAAAERAEFAAKIDRVLAHMHKNPHHEYTKRKLRDAADVGDAVATRIVNALERANMIKCQPAVTASGTDGPDKYVLVTANAPRHVVVDERGECHPALPGPGSVGGFVRSRVAAPGTAGS